MDRGTFVAREHKPKERPNMERLPNFFSGKQPKSAFGNSLVLPVLWRWFLSGVFLSVEVSFVFWENLSVNDELSTNES